MRTCQTLSVSFCVVKSNFTLSLHQLWLIHYSLISSSRWVQSLFFFFLLLLNKDFIAQKTQLETGRYKKIRSGPISNKSLRNMRTQIEDGDRSRPIYKGCLLSKQMSRYITHYMNKRKFNIRKPMDKEQDIIQNRPDTPMRGYI